MNEPNLPVLNPQQAVPAPPDVPVWRRKPYRVFFPLGFALSWAGVLHWWLYGLGVTDSYHAVFHSIAQIQGFLLCFALGFLMTAIPGRTGTARPATWEIVIGVIAPIGTTVTAWFELFAWSQAFWLVLVVMLLVFALRRFTSPHAGRRPPVGFLWVPLSFAMGLVGSVLIGIYGIFGETYFRLHELGRLYLLQGMFIGLVVGVGSMVLPLLTHGANSRDLGSTPQDLRALAGNLLGAVALIASLHIENSGMTQAGLALRAVVVLAMLVGSSGVLRPPTVPGWHRRLLWLSAWMIPLGYTIAAIDPVRKLAGLHVVFIGGFALMAFSVGLHITLAHGGYKELVRGRAWQVPVYGSLILLTVVFRALAEFDRDRYLVWIAVAATTFLAGSFAWAAFALPRMWIDQRD